MHSIELNPVQPNAEDLVMIFQGEYLAMGAIGEERQLAYRILFAGAIEERNCLLVRTATQQGVLVGDNRVTEGISARSGQAVHTRRGRPSKKEQSCGS